MDSNSPLAKLLFRNSNTPESPPAESEKDYSVDEEIEEYQDELFGQAADWYEKNKSDDPWGQSPGDKAASASFFGNMPTEISNEVKKIQNHREGGTPSPFKKFEGF